jgi:DHA3 family macrolide efflux protein-like MFS transporter
MQQETSVGFIQVLRNGRFARLWLGQVISAIGDYFYFLAVPILINKLNGSTAAIGLAMILGFALPQLLFGIPAGVLVDRWDRRRVMIVADVLRAALVLGGLLVHNVQTIWILYAVGFMVSVASRFFFPARSALIPALVSENELVAANGLAQLTETASLLAGPALAGFMIGWFGESVAFVVDSASFIVSALAIWSIGAVMAQSAQVAPEQTARALQIPFRGLWSELVEGLRLLFGHPVLRGIVLSFAVVHLGLGAINVLWVPLLSRNYGVGPEGMGVVDSIQGVGMAVGGFAVGWLAARFSKARIGAVGLMVVGLMLGFTGVAPSFVYIIVFSFVLGLALAPIEAALTTLMQQLTPDRSRGRVFSALGTFGSIAGMLSMACAGGAAELVGIPTVYLACGAVVMLAGLLFGALVKEPRPVPSQMPSVAEPV